MGKDGSSEYDFLGNIQIFKDSTARSDGLKPVAEFSFSVQDRKDSTAFTEFFSTDTLDSTNVNIVEQTYNYMKTQSDLAGIDYTDGTDV